MIVKEYEHYRLLLGVAPEELFEYFSVLALHGLNYADAIEYPNEKDDSYIAGLCNISPGDSKPFVFINMTRCTDDVKTTGLVFHEMIHLVSRLWQGCWDSDEEEMVTFAENETYNAVEIIKRIKDEYKNQKRNT